MYIKKIRQKKPLIHHITNYVVANETANLTIALGALPVMTYAKPEVEEMVSIASALLINIGTLDEYQVESIMLAGRKANEIGVPVVFDPVGAGATSYRTDVSRRILKEIKVDVIRGNSAEISILAGYKAEVAGVEAISTSKDIDVVVKELAFKNNCIVWASGATDYISDGKRVALVYNGHPALGLVTGTGCMATTIAAVFASVAEDKFDAIVNAAAAFGVAGELAFEKSGENPGAYHQSLYDAVYHLSDEVVAARKRVEIIE